MSQDIDKSWDRVVGVAGFEPATPSSRTRCATRLRYTPPRRAACNMAMSRPARAPPPLAQRAVDKPVVAGGCVEVESRVKLWLCPPPRNAPIAVRPLGRRQAVRQGILIPPCGGSNPPAPAKNLFKIKALHSRRGRHSRSARSPIPVPPPCSAEPKPPTHSASLCRSRSNDGGPYLHWRPRGSPADRPWSYVMVRPQA